MLVRTWSKPMPRIVDLTLPVRSGISGIPRIPLYEQHPATVRAATVVSEAQRELLVREGVEVMPGAPAATSQRISMRRDISLPRVMRLMSSASSDWYSARQSSSM
ncbi:MAG: hypothetical protein EBT33_15260 [Betaproteobacteria bacterium]|nr:hypothetical protein [Betaproteobacteria bacterium]